MEEGTQTWGLGTESMKELGGLVRRGAITPLAAQLEAGCRGAGGARERGRNSPQDGEGQEEGRPGEGTAGRAVGDVLMESPESQKPLQAPSQEDSCSGSPVTPSDGQLRVQNESCERWGRGRARREGRRKEQSLPPHGADAAEVLEEGASSSADVSQGLGLRGAGPAGWASTPPGQCQEGCPAAHPAGRPEASSAEGGEGCLQLGAG